MPSTRHENYFQLPCVVLFLADPRLDERLGVEWNSLEHRTRSHPPSLTVHDCTAPEAGNELVCATNPRIASINSCGPKWTLSDRVSTALHHPRKRTRTSLELAADREPTFLPAEAGSYRSLVIAEDKFARTVRPSEWKVREIMGFP